MGPAYGETMQGQILQVGGADGSGLILGDDGNRYAFSLAEWKVANPPVAGMTVDYLASGSFAREIYPVPGIGAQPQASIPGVQPAIAQSNASTLGGIGILCLAIGFFIPLLPTIAALVLGLMGAESAKRAGDHNALVLSRIAWIGAVVVLVIGAVMIALGLGFLVTIMHMVFNEMRSAGGMRV
jgi:hypothetical protein